MTVLHAERARPAVRRLRETPFTVGYLVVVGVSTAALAVAGSDATAAVLRDCSTDLVHLARHPLFALLTSALWVEGARAFVTQAVVLGLAAALLERRAGSRTVIGVFAAGHVGATLLTEGSVAAGVLAGVLPVTAASRLDVGISYGLAATLGAVAGLLPARWRIVALLAIWCYLGLPLALDFDMTAWGHLTAMAIGVAWWPAIRRRAGRLDARAGAALGIMEV